MIMKLLRQYRCTHHWETLTRYPFKFGCEKCGKYTRVWSWDYPEWQFRRKYKGDTFK